MSQYLEFLRYVSSVLEFRCLEIIVVDTSGTGRIRTKPYPKHRRDDG